MILNYAKNLKKWNRGTLFCNIFTEKTVIRGIVMGHVHCVLEAGMEASIEAISACELPTKVGGVFLGEVDM